jgi:Zn-finger nucleic acid-binding protein
MNCPKCKNIELKKKAHGEPYSCPDCQGLWLQTSELENFIDCCHELKEDENPSGSQHDSKTGICPVDGNIMIRARVELDKPFYLEKCTVCGGIWFDKGEWRLIADNQLMDNLNDFWTRSWQKKQRKEKEMDEYFQLNRKLLGSELFDSILALSKILKNHPEKNRALALLKEEILS